jgi:hypothetical protein
MTLPLASKSPGQSLLAFSANVEWNSTQDGQLRREREET